jgi:hypothetical protein
VQPSVAEAWSLSGYLSQATTQGRLVPLFPLVPPTPAVHPDQPTGASLTQPAFFASHPHGLSFCPRAYHFFDSTTLSASISSAMQ